MMPEGRPEAKVQVAGIGQMSASDSSWRMENDTLHADAGAGTDHFVSPDRFGGEGGPRNLTASRLLVDPPEGDFVFSARASADFRAPFDAATLFLESDDLHWAKLCFEADPYLTPTVVSVVTRTLSDDATAFPADQPHVWLRVARMGAAYAFHASLDGQEWEFLRFFNLVDPSTPVKIGFGAQSPVGEGCAVRFEDVTFEQRTLAQLRDGT